MGEVLEAGILSRWKAGERGRKYVTMQNISKSKKGYKGGSHGNGVIPGKARYERREVSSPSRPNMRMRTYHVLLGVQVQ